MTTLLVHLNERRLLDWKLSEHGARWHSNRRNIEAVIDEVRGERPDLTAITIDYLDAKERARC